MRSDLITGVVGILFSAAYLYGVTMVKIFTGSSTGGVSAQTVPSLWGYGLLILSVLLVIRAVLNRKKSTDTPLTMRRFLDSVKEHREVIGTFILLILYAVLMKPVGFILMSIAYIYLQIMLVTPPEKRTKKHRVTSAGLAVVFSVALYFIFTKYLMVMLPAGIL